MILTIISPSIVRADEQPFYPLAEQEDTYVPTGSHNDWDYYILPPETLHTGVTYWGASLDSVSGDAEYINVRQDDFSSPNVGLTYSASPTVNVRQSDTRATEHDFFDRQPYPSAVRIGSEYEPEFIKRQRNPINLHIDYSVTFFAEANVNYWGFINRSEPFFIDVALSSKDAGGQLWFESTHPLMGYNLGMPENKMTYPFVPFGNGPQEFLFNTTESTLVTLTPHNWKFPTYFPDLEQQSIFSEEFDQGDPWLYNPDTDSLEEPDNHMFSLRMFNLSIEADKYYRINTVFEMDEVKPGVLSSTPYMFVIGENYQYIEGSLDDEGAIIYAMEDEGLILVMYSPGEAHGRYSLFYQEVPSTDTGLTKSLPLNTDTRLEYNTDYLFTLSSPTMIRVNDTGTFQYEISKAGDIPGTWTSPITDETFIGTTWRYVPAGVYKLELMYRSSIDAEIRFNTATVQTPSSLPITVSEGSNIAVELPIMKNRISYINLSTTDQSNLSVTYDYYISGIYNELVDVIDTSIALGNRQQFGSWEAYPTNDTTIAEYLPTREYERPVIVVTPTSAINSTGGAVSDYSTSIKISSTVLQNQAFADQSLSGRYNAFSGTGFDGYFLPQASISSSRPYTVNSDVAVDRNLVYGIPLAIDRYSIYNISVRLVGNYSDVNDLNATFDNTMLLQGGNSKYLEIFMTPDRVTTNEYQQDSVLILTVSDLTYLYVDVLRETTNHNATLQVTITKLPATAMQFAIDQVYNNTISEYEVKSTSLLVKEIKPSEMKKAAPGFELSLVFIALVISSVFASRKRRNR